MSLEIVVANNVAKEVPYPLPVVVVLIVKLCQRSFRSYTNIDETGGTINVRFNDHFLTGL